MRNRDTLAYVPQLLDDRKVSVGLTKREAAAIAMRAGLEASDHGTPMIKDGPDCEERRMTPAEYAVREADALFDELEKGDG